MQRIDVVRLDTTYTCRPKTAVSCGAEVPVSRNTCPACKQRQLRPVAPAGGTPIANAILFDSGRPIALIAQVSDSAAGFVAAQARQWVTRDTKGRPRLSGLGDRQAMFGTLAPQPLRQRYGCTRSRVARGSDVDQWNDVAAECQAVFEANLPDTARANVELAGAVADVWKFPGTGWTSGVLNLSQLLPYHRDAGNLAGSWSAMIGARSGTTGGNLYLPEYDVTLDVGHRSLLCFPGADIVHGVTPMRVQRNGWRVTAVFYGLRGCIQCLDTQEAEMERASARSTVRARAIANPTPKEPTVPRPAPATRPAKTEAEHLDDLVAFARLMVDTGDLEPWAGMLGLLYRNGHVTREQALWLVKLYNCYDALGSAWGMFRRWPSIDAWARDEPEARKFAATFNCTQERRNLRGGKVLIHLADYAKHVRAGEPGHEGVEPWLRAGLRTGRPGADFLTLAEHVRRVWGVGRQTAFEWVEFLGKVCDFPVTAPNAMLWESEGPRRALQRLYGNPKPDAKWLDRRAIECRRYLAERGVEMPWEDFETVICDFNVMRDGRYYVGRHLAALREEIDEITDPDDKELLMATFTEYCPDPAWAEIPPGINKQQMVVYRDTGRIIDSPLVP